MWQQVSEMPLWRRYGFAPFVTCACVHEVGHMHDAGGGTAVHRSLRGTNFDGPRYSSLMVLTLCRALAANVSLVWLDADACLFALWSFFAPPGLPG